MTSASVSLLTPARLGAAVGGLAAVLVLTGCSGGDTNDDGARGGSGPGGASASVSASASAAASQSPARSSSGATDTGDGSGARGGSLEGSWLATSGGKMVALMIDGQKAALLDSGGNSCSGTASNSAGMQMITLKCGDGNADRGQGMVDSVDDTTLKITWEGGLGDETYTKSKDGKLPEGLPTNGLKP